MATNQTHMAAAHDLELVALSAAGSPAAFGELVRRHGAAVRGLLRRMGADPALADDLAQDAFLAAYEQIAEFRGDGAFQGWVKRIAARLYVKRWRKDVRTDLMAEPPEPGPSNDPGDRGADRRIDLDQAMRALSPAERICVSLCYGAGLSHGEAALALNTPLGTVKSHVKRGLDKLRDRLAPGGSSRRRRTRSMADRTFEMTLERLFAEEPSFRDGGPVRRAGHRTAQSRLDIPTVS